MVKLSLDAVDILVYLLQSEWSSLFRTIDTISPYVDRHLSPLRRNLREMGAASRKRIERLALAVEALGGIPEIGPGIAEEREESYLALRFLLPRMVREQRRLVEQYGESLHRLESGGPVEIVEILRQHLAEHVEQLKMLEQYGQTAAANH